MMRKLMKKLKSKVGETLIESLAAILVFTLSSIALLSMLSSSAKINTTAKEMDRAFQEQMVVAEEASGEQQTGRATFTLTSEGNGQGNQLAAADVYIYQQSAEDDTLYAYYEQEDTGS